MTKLCICKTITSTGKKSTSGVSFQFCRKICQKSTRPQTSTSPNLSVPRWDNYMSLQEPQTFWSPPPQRLPPRPGGSGTCWWRCRSRTAHSGPCRAGGCSPPVITQDTRVTACTLITMCCSAERVGQACHLQVPVDDGSLALVQLGDGVTGVAEDLQHLGLGKARLQSLVHQVDHLTT